jgi:glycosyltransferase involved in cell wall biosynthesis
MIDVFICTYNPNHEYLLQTIEGILKQDLSHDEWSLTIIDNNSSASVAEIDFVKELKIRTIVEKKQGLTAARACAVNNSSGDILIFVDDDNILETNYLSTTKQIFSNDGELVLLSGNIVPMYIRQPPKWFTQFEPMLAIRRLDSNQSVIYNSLTTYNLNFPIGAGMAVRSTFIKDYYDNHLSAGNYIEGRKGDELSSGEDLDLDLYAISKGFKLGVSPFMKLIHIIPERRILPKYIAKLGVESIKSGYQLNAKWSPVFDNLIFDYFGSSAVKLRIKLFISSLLSFNNAFYIKAEFYRELLKHK